MTKRRLKAYFYLIAVAAIWGAAGPVIKFTLGGIDPLPFLAYRLTISATFSIIYFLFKKPKFPKPKTTIPYVIIYGLLAVTFALGPLFVGLDKSTVLDLALIGTIGPLVVTLGGALFFRERITHREKIGIAIVFLGASINSFVPLLTESSGLHLTGNLLIVTFLLTDSAAILFAKKVVREKIKPLTLTNMAFIVGALTIGPFAMLTHGSASLINQIINLPFKYHLGVWYMALLSGSLAYFLFVKAEKTIEVSEAILFNYLQPLFSVPLAIFWLGEKFTSTFITGAILITTGIIIAEYKSKKHKTS